MRQTSRCEATSTSSSDDETDHFEQDNTESIENIYVMKSYLQFLPLELYLEIASYLLPDDLLRLSRVCHDLRCSTLSRQSRHEWIACIAHSGLPSCPADLSEPKYAALMYENVCDVCGSPCVKNCIFHLTRVRLCDTCFIQEMENEKTIATEVDGPLYTYDWFALVFILAQADGKDALSACSFSMNFASAVAFAQTFFIKVLGSPIAIFPTANMTEREAFLHKQMERNREIYQHWLSLDNWLEIRFINEISEAAKERKAFIESVLAYVKDQGYCSKDWDNLESACQTRWDTHLRYKLPKEFEPQELSTLISELIVVIKDDRIAKEKRRRERLKIDRTQDVICHYLDYIDRTCSNQHGEDITMPSLPKILQMKPVIDLMMENNDANEIKSTSWESRLPELRPLFDEHRTAIIERHSKAIEGWTKKHNFDSTIHDMSEVDQLYLASTFFRSKAYNGPYYVPIGSPAIVGIRKTPKWFDGFINVYDLREDTTFLNIKIHAVAVEAAEALLKCLQLPQTTSMSEILQHTVDRMLCERCHEDTKTLTTWPLMIRHYSRELAWSAKPKELTLRNPDVDLFNNHSLTNSRPLVRLVEKKDMPKYAFLHDRHKLGQLRYPGIEDIEDDFEKQESNPGRFICTLCEKIGASSPLMTKKRMIAHLQSKHGKYTVRNSDFRLEDAVVSE